MAIWANQILNATNIVDCPFQILVSDSDGKAVMSVVIKTIRWPKLDETQTYASFSLADET